LMVSVCILGGMKVDGERLRALRLAKGLANNELAHDARIDPANLSKMERGKAGASMPALRRLAAALDVPVTELYAEKINLTPPPAPANAAA